MDTIEIFEYLKERNTIQGIDIEDLKELLMAPYDGSNNKSYKNLKTRMINDDFILLFDKDKNTSILLECVKKYYNLENSVCSRIKKELDTYNDNQSNCINCHLKCINKRQNGEL